MSDVNTTQETSNGWWPIEAHPGDDKLVDLWVVNADGDAGRKTDCRWLNWHGHLGEWYTTDIMVTRVESMGEGGWRPTHWRPIPSGPRSAA
jgi:hypothetical protein